MPKQLVAAQIGCGAFAQDQHGPNCVRNPHIKNVKWACDLKKSNAQAYVDKTGAKNITSSFEDATTDPEVDIICIATSHEVHVPIIESAAEHGKHIFCEKPMAMNEVQAYKIISAVRKHGVRLCVDYMRRSAPAVVALKREWLAHKSQPRHQPWRYIEKPRKKLLEETHTEFLVRVQDESASYRMVHLDPIRGGGLIIGEAVHWLDLATWLFDDDRPLEVYAWGSSRMRYGIHLEFQSGNSATIIFSPNGTFDYPKEMYEITHNGALFRMEHFVENQYFGRPGNDKEVFPLQHNPLPDIGKQGGLSGYLEKYSKLVSNVDNAKNKYIAITADHGYESHFDAFVDAIIDHGSVPCDEMAGYRATLLGELAIKSITLRQPIPVPMEKWDLYVEID